MSGGRPSRSGTILGGEVAERAGGWPMGLVAVTAAAAGVNLGIGARRK